MQYLQDCFAVSNIEQTMDIKLSVDFSDINLNDCVVAVELLQWIIMTIRSCKHTMSSIQLFNQILSKC